MPVEVNVKLNVPPGGRSADAQTPVSDVDVWLVTPLFVQVTVAPTGTVSALGVKAKSVMETDDEGDAPMTKFPFEASVTATSASHVMRILAAAELQAPKTVTGCVPSDGVEARTVIG